MKRLILTMVALGLGLAYFPSAANAQAPDANNVLVLYGKDKCPINDKGEEIVVCVRKPESDRFRIPKELRRHAPSAQSIPWTNRIDSFRNIGATGVGSCSSSGPGGFTGCMAQEAANYKEDYRQMREQRLAQENRPDPVATSPVIKRTDTSVIVQDDNAVGPK